MADIKSHASLTTGLVSYWDLEEASGTRYDLHGSNNLTDGNTVTQVAGKIGNCADFTLANNEYLSITDGSQTGLDTTGDFTIQAWVNVDNAPATNTQNSIVNKVDFGAGTKYGYSLFYWNDNGTYKIRFLIYNEGAGGVNNINFTQTLTLDTWYHLVFRFTSSTKEHALFVNNSKSTQTGTYNNGNSGSDFSISRNGTAWDGMIEEVALWSKALTDQEVTDLYNSGNGLPYYDPTDIKDDSTLSTSLVSYWKLDETSGTRNDSHGTNHLTDTNTVLYGTGKINNAADFEATNSEYLTITDGSQSGLDMTGDMSFSSWINIESLASAGSDRPILSKWNGGGWMMYTRYSSPTHYISVGVNSAVNVSVAWTPSTSTWYHVCTTYKQSTGATNVYLNGVLLGTGTASTTNPNNAHNFSIGMYEAGAAVFDGLIDETAVYSKVLTTAEVRALYGYGTPPEYDVVTGGGFTPSPMMHMMAVSGGLL